jgi:hypothetical protein
MCLQAYKMLDGIALGAASTTWRLAMSKFATKRPRLEEVCRRQLLVLSRLSHHYAV